MQLHPNAFIQLLAGGIDTPAPLAAFLSFHTKRGGTPTATNAETVGLLRKMVNRIKGE
jgi:hypothetical protein